MRDLATPGGGGSCFSGSSGLGGPGLWGIGNCCKSRFAARVKNGTPRPSPHKNFRLLSVIYSLLKRHRQPSFQPNGREAQLPGPMLYSRSDNLMSSYFTHWPEFGPSTALHLVVILIFALILSRFARSITNRLVRPAGSQVRAAQLREEQTRAASNTLYRAITRIIWTVALLASLPVLGVNIFPLLILATLAIVIAAFAAQNLLRDLIAGFTIIFEDQFTAGELIEVNGAAGRVEQITLRRTVIRDARGALVTIANAKIRTVSNLSRDWSQAFVDVSLAPESPVEKPLQALETAAAALRGDRAWWRALLDAPRILGVQRFD